MSQFDIFLPDPDQLPLDVTDESLYGYELDDKLNRQLQQAAATEVDHHLLTILHDHLAAGHVAYQSVAGGKTEYVAKFSEEAKAKLASGEWQLGIRKQTKEMYGVLVDTTTHKLRQSVTLEPKVIQQLGNLPELAALQGQLQAVSEQITALTQAVERVEQGQYNDRFAGVFAARQLLIEGLVAADPRLKRQLLTQSVQTGTETIAKIMLTLRSDARRLASEKLKPKQVRPLEALVQESIAYLNTAVQMNLSAYTALGEERALLATMSNYRAFIHQSLLKEEHAGQHSVAWLIDNGHQGEDGQVRALTQDIFDQSSYLIKAVKQDTIGEEAHEKIESTEAMPDAELPQGS